MLIADATGASSSVPAAFKPKILRDGFFNTNYLIDGGLIANNPGLYSYMLTKYLSKKLDKGDRIRLLSFSTGIAPQTKDFRTLDKLGWKTNLVEAIVDIDVFMSS
jgi:patatin-like phospholipase/acyl hydrolase